MTQQIDTERIARAPSPAFLNLVNERNTWRAVAYAFAEAVFGPNDYRDQVARAYGTALWRAGEDTWSLTPAGIEELDRGEPAATPLRRSRKPGGGIQ
jgi:hypothetical protein